MSIVTLLERGRSLAEQIPSSALSLSARLAVAAIFWRSGQSKVSGFDIREDTRFICSHDRFRRWASGKSSLRMEFFYREMRRETGILLRTADFPLDSRFGATRPTWNDIQLICRRPARRGRPGGAE